MSFWGATVITNLLSPFPSLIEWVSGGHYVYNPTLKRFFIFHFQFPFLLCGFTILHLFYLHFLSSITYFGSTEIWSTDDENNGIQLDVLHIQNLTQDPFINLLKVLPLWLQKTNPLKKKRRATWIVPFSRCSCFLLEFLFNDAAVNLDA